MYQTFYQGSSTLFKIESESEEDSGEEDQEATYWAYHLSNPITSNVRLFTSNSSSLIPINWADLTTAVFFSIYSPNSLPKLSCVIHTLS